MNASGDANWAAMMARSVGKTRADLISSTFLAIHGLGVGLACSQDRAGLLFEQCWRRLVDLDYGVYLDHERKKIYIIGTGGWIHILSSGVGLHGYRVSFTGTPSPNTVLETHPPNFPFCGMAPMPEIPDPAGGDEDGSTAAFTIPSTPQGHSWWKSLWRIPPDHPGLT